MAADIRVPTTGNAGEDAVVLEWNVKRSWCSTSPDVSKQSTWSRRC